MKKDRAFTPLETIKRQKKKTMSLTGFTLIELLMAASIFVVVMSAIYSAFHTGIFGYRNMEESIDTYQTARQILERLNLELRNSFAYSQEEAKFEGKSKQISFLALADVYQGDKIAQCYAFISYALEGDRLMRLCRKNQEALNNKSEIKSEEMADNIEINFSYFYLDPADNSLKEKDLWDDQKSLPVAVKISLTIKGKREANFARMVYLPLAK